MGLCGSVPLREVFRADQQPVEADEGEKERKKKRVNIKATGSPAGK